MTSEQKNKILMTVGEQLQANRKAILSCNQEDLESYTGNDGALHDRLKVDDAKVDGMILSVREVLEKPDPVNLERYRFDHPNGMTVINRTAPFGTILIIYESRPDVTIEAAALAFKSGNRILLKGGKEARRSNLQLVKCWHEALRQNGAPEEWVQYLDYSRQEIRQFLKKPDVPLDLVVPRGGDQLIAFVKEYATCPVLVSGRGNNFLYVHPEADWSKAVPIVLNAKTQKISACNALDKVLLDTSLPALQARLNELTSGLVEAGVEVSVSHEVKKLLPGSSFQVAEGDEIWEEEFLAMKIVVGLCNGVEEAVEKINRYSGGHSASILTENEQAAGHFMEHVDAAAVYHNASTRFTDGGQFGLGAELAISTDKLHHRGPLGLEHLVTNKWFVYGNGQVRK